MPLSLKDVYVLRSGLMDFTNKLFKDNGGNFVFKNTKEKRDKLITYLHHDEYDKPKRREKEPEEAYKGRYKAYKKELQNRVKAYKSDYSKLLFKGQVEVSRHMIALDVYQHLLEQEKELKSANKGKEDSLVIKEFSKNVEYFKSQLIKNDVYNFEIEDKLKNDKNLQEKIKKGVAATLSDDNAELLINHGVSFHNGDPTKFSAEFKELIDFENLADFEPKEISNNNSAFYGMLKEAGFSYAKHFDTAYYQLPKTVQECPSGYKFNEAGEMVEKESKGFFQAISNFFGRLINGSKAKAYNESLKQTKEALDEVEFNKDILERKSIEAEKKLINLDKEFDMENDYQKDNIKENIAIQRLETEKDMEGKDIEGPGLNQLD